MDGRTDLHPFLEWISINVIKDGHFSKKWPGIQWNLLKIPISLANGKYTDPHLFPKGIPANAGEDSHVSWKWLPWGFNSGHGRTIWMPQSVIDYVWVWKDDEMKNISSSHWLWRGEGEGGSQKEDLMLSWRTVPCHHPSSNCSSRRGVEVMPKCPLWSEITLTAMFWVHGRLNNMKKELTREMQMWSK